MTDTTPEQMRALAYVKSLPTREQIAEVLVEHYAWGRADDEDLEAADAVLAILNGADR